MRVRVQPGGALLLGNGCDDYGVNPDDLISKLSLQPHPEGGWYRQTYRSEGVVDATRGVRAASTAIYFLLQGDEFSALHRIASDEVWHFYMGSPLRVEAITPEGVVESFVLGNDLAANEVLQAWVPAGRWFGASLAQGGWALVGCTVAPGFEFMDFEMGDRDALLNLFPQCQDVVRRLTRSQKD
jgi:predicted cupin superfamily sugar epimerase